MSYKNAKTVLFASLIAAMVLSFSGMNYAIAQETNDTQNDLDKIQKILGDYRQALNEAKEDEKIKYLQLSMDRLVLAEQIIIESNNIGEGFHIQSERADLQDLIFQLEATYETVNVTSEETVPGIQSHYFDVFKK